MTDKKIKKIHALTDGVTIMLANGTGHVCMRGETFELTDQFVLENTDRNGFSWTSVLDDPMKQIEYFGVIAFGMGDFPDGLVPAEVGSWKWQELRAAQILEAEKITDQKQRREALRDVEKNFPRAYDGSVARSRTTIFNEDRDSPHDRKVKAAIGQQGTMTGAAGAAYREQRKQQAIAEYRRSHGLAP